jgi:hypothetical protein
MISCVRPKINVTENLEIFRKIFGTKQAINETMKHVQKQFREKKKGPAVSSDLV